MEDYTLAKGEAQKKYYDRIHAKPEAFTIGDKVLVNDFLKKEEQEGNCASI